MRGKGCVRLALLLHTNHASISCKHSNLHISAGHPTLVYTTTTTKGAAPGTQTATPPLSALSPPLPSLPPPQLAPGIWTMVKLQIPSTTGALLLLLLNATALVHASKHLDTALGRVPHINRRSHEVEKRAYSGTAT